METENDQCTLGNLSFIKKFVVSTRFILIIPSLSIILISIIMFLLVSWHSLIIVQKLVTEASHAEITTYSVLIDVIGIINTVLKAIIFYVIGLGIFSLFLEKIPVCSLLGINTLKDLEAKIISIIIVILSVKYLEIFLKSEGGLGLLYQSVSIATIVAGLTLFLRLYLARK